MLPGNPGVLTCQKCGGQKDVLSLIRKVNEENERFSTIKNAVKERAEVYDYAVFRI